MRWAKAPTALPQWGSWQPRMGPTASRVPSRTLLRETEMWRSQSWKCFDLGIYLKAQIRCQFGACSCVPAELWWSTVHPMNLHTEQPGTGWGGPWLPTHTPTSSSHEIQRVGENGRLLHTLVSPWHSQDVTRAIIPYITIILPLSGDYQVALFFLFPDYTWNRYFLLLV